METIKSEHASASASPADKLPELMGAEILVRSLIEEQVKYIWGYPGGAVPTFTTHSTNKT